LEEAMSVVLAKHAIEIDVGEVNDRIFVNIQALDCIHRLFGGENYSKNGWGGEMVRGFLGDTHCVAPSFAFRR
jgi:hypothetical protein